MKHLALDIGEKRIGVAVSDEEGIVARPLLTLKVTDELFSDLGKIIEDEKPGVVVFGLPRHMSGEVGESAKGIKEMASEVEKKFKVKTAFQDESLTSVEAERRLRESGFLPAKIKEMVDSEAAAIILEDYLEN